MHLFFQETLVANTCTCMCSYFFNFLHRTNSLLTLSEVCFCLFMSVSQCIYTGKPVHLCVLHNELCIWIGESSTCYWYVLQLYNNLHYSAIFLLHHSRDPRSWFEIRIFVQINTFRITKQVLSHLRQYHLFEHFSPVWKNPSSNNAHKCRHCSEIVKFWQKSLSLMTL